MFRIDGETLEIRDLGTPAGEPEALFRWKLHRLIAHHAKGPDGKIYFTMHFSGNLYALDPETLRIDKLSLVPAGKWRDTPPLCGFLRELENADLPSVFDRFSSDFF